MQAAAVGIALANENLALAIAEARQGWQLSMGACLVNEATVSANTEAVTEDNCKNVVLGVRKEVVKAKGTADIILCSPDFYTTVLAVAGKEFTPTINDRINATGNVGKWLGFTFVEFNGLAEASAKYYNYENNLKTVDFTGVDFIMYNHEALSGVTNFEAARLKDAEGFVGTLAQTEMNSGFRVTNSALAYVHKHTA